MSESPTDRELLDLCAKSSLIAANDEAKLAHRWFEREGDGVDEGSVTMRVVRHGDEGAAVRPLYFDVQAEFKIETNDAMSDFERVADLARRDLYRGPSLDEALEAFEAALAAFEGTGMVMRTDAGEEGTIDRDRVAERIGELRPSAECTLEAILNPSLADISMFQD